MKPAPFKTGGFVPQGGDAPVPERAAAEIPVGEKPAPVSMQVYLAEIAPRSAWEQVQDFFRDLAGQTKPRKDENV